MQSPAPAEMRGGGFLYSRLISLAHYKIFIPRLPPQPFGGFLTPHAGFSDGLNFTPDVGRG